VADRLSVEEVEGERNGAMEMVGIVGGGEEVEPIIRWGRLSGIGVFLENGVRSGANETSLGQLLFAGTVR